MSAFVLTLSNLAVAALFSVVLHVPTMICRDDFFKSAGEMGSAVHPGKTMAQAYPERFSSGRRNNYFSGGSSYKRELTKFKKLLETDADAAQCLKEAQQRGDTELFDGFSGPTETYCVCLHSGGSNKEMCRIQAQIVYRAFSNHFNAIAGCESAVTTCFKADKRKVDDAAKNAELFFVSGPETVSTRFPCSAVNWVKETRKLSFSSECGKATYSGDASWTREVEAFEKGAGTWNMRRSLYYDGEISSAEISATVDFGPQAKAEDAKTVDMKCTAKAAASNHHIVVSDSIDKSREKDLKSEETKNAATREVTDALRKLNEQSGMSEGDFICEILKKAIAKAVKELPKAGVNLLKVDSGTYSNEQMQQLTTL